MFFRRKGAVLHPDGRIEGRFACTDGSGNMYYGT